MKKISFKKRSAMTLVELIVYLSITMVVCVLIVEMTSRMMAVKINSVGENEVAANANLLLDRLTYEAANAQSLLGEFPSNNLVLQSNAQNLSFNLLTGQIFCQDETLTNSLVEIAPVAPGGYLYELINNNGFKTIKVEFQAKSKTSNFTRNYQTIINVGSHV